MTKHMFLTKKILVAAVFLVVFAVQVPVAMTSSQVNLSRQSPPN